MSTDHQCQARQYSDQMCCGKCGLAWDVNDPEPPKCKRHDDTKPKAAPVMATIYRVYQIALPVSDDNVQTLRDFLDNAREDPAEVFKHLVQDDVDGKLYDEEDDHVR